MNIVLTVGVIVAVMLAAGGVVVLAARSRCGARAGERSARTTRDTDGSDLDPLLASAAWHSVAGLGHDTTGPGGQAAHLGPAGDLHHREPHAGQHSAPPERGDLSTSDGVDPGAGDGGSGGDGGGGD